MKSSLVSWLIVLFALLFTIKGDIIYDFTGGFPPSTDSLFYIGGNEGAIANVRKKKLKQIFLLNFSSFLNKSTLVLPQQIYIMGLNLLCKNIHLLL